MRSLIQLIFRINRIHLSLNQTDLLIMIRNKVLTEAIDNMKNGIISKKILSVANGNVTLFSFDKGQSLTEHSTPHAVLLMALEGKADFSLGKKSFTFLKGEYLILEPGELHALNAVTEFKMLMALIKS